MNGCDAVMYGILDANASVATGVIGFPVTELIRKLKPIWRNTTNEKVGLELALGASASGVRSVFITKHVGLNVASDPLITAATHRIGAGLVVIAGDDPGAKYSQNEQDSRYYGKIAEIPVIEPCTLQKAYDSLIEAFDISDALHIPIIVRVTGRLLQMTGDFERAHPQSPDMHKINKGIWNLTFLGRHQHFVKSIYPIMQEFAERSNLHDRIGKGSIGLISSGYVSNIVDCAIDGRTDITHFKLGVTYPLCERKIKSFLEQHDRILIIEEGGPVIEESIRPRVLGKLTGHLPRYGEISVDSVKKALTYIEADYLNFNFTVETLEARGYLGIICDDCPFIPFYQAISETNTMVAGDMGCIIRTANPPYNLIDTAYSLGSAIGVAAGFKDGGVAILGDYAFLHSGVETLINAALFNYDVKVFVLENRVSAITGGQSVPEVSDLISAITHNYGIYSKIIHVANTTKQELKNIVDAALHTKGVVVIILKGSCPKYS